MRKLEDGLCKEKELRKWVERVKGGDMDEIQVGSWNELQDRLFEDSWDQKYQKHISPYVFRGLNDKDHDPSTTLIRLCHSGSNLDKVERALIRNFHKYSPPDAPRSESFWHLLVICRHHGLPTRLLDWTYSPFVAMHFATADTDKFNKDGAIWAVNFKEAHKYLPQKLKKRISESKAWLFTVEMFSESLKDLDKFDRSKKSPFILFFEPPAIDERIVNQFAVFSVVSNVNVVPHEWLVKRPVTYRKIITPAQLKKEIREKLDQSNITERVLYPGLDGLCTWLKRHYEPR